MNTPARYDAVVVGAGPYGLSTAAHLIGRGLKVGVFGKPLELWRCHMPKGMRLRSHSWASSISDPKRAFGFERFLAQSTHTKDYPLSAEAFIEYGLWFQKHAVPNVDDTYVSSIDGDDRRFVVTLADGRAVASSNVVMATGPACYAYRPGEFAGGDPRLISHTCDHHDLSGFHDSTVVVIGGGQSALEHAALLHEAGANVHVVSRRAIVWLAPDTEQRRPVLDRLIAPDTSLSPGWKNWLLEHAPFVFYRFSEERKDRANRNYYLSAGSDWLRGRVLGRVTLHERRTARLDSAGDHVAVRLSSGETIEADHVMLATGYRVDIDKLTPLRPLRNRIHADEGIPTLNARFESSVRGLYFVGLTSLRAFGPVFRFVGGCDAAARRVSRAIAQT